MSTEFDEWLARVKAEAWDEGFNAWALAPAGDQPLRGDNPYRSEAGADRLSGFGEQGSK